MILRPPQGAHGKAGLGHGHGHGFPSISSVHGLALGILDSASCNEQVSILIVSCTGFNSQKCNV